MPVGIILRVFVHIMRRVRLAAWSPAACGAARNSTPTSSAERHTMRDHRVSRLDSLIRNCSGRLSGWRTLSRTPPCDRSAKSQARVDPSTISISAERSILLRGYFLLSAVMSEYLAVKHDRIERATRPHHNLKVLQVKSAFISSRVSARPPRRNGSKCLHVA